MTWDSTYHEQVEQLFSNGANTIGKQHFTLLYGHARRTALTSRNIRSGWSKAGLWPFNTQRVLGKMSKPKGVQLLCIVTPNVEVSLPSLRTPLQTPMDATSLKALRYRAEAYFKTTDDDPSSFFEKFANAAEVSMAYGALIENRIDILQKQNDEKKLRQATRPTILGRGKILSWPDIVAAREKQDQKAARIRKCKPVGRTKKDKAAAIPSYQRRRSQVDEVAEARREIEAAGLTDFCTVFRIGN